MKQIIKDIQEKIDYKNIDDQFKDTKYWWGVTHLFISISLRVECQCDA